MPNRIKADSASGLQLISDSSDEIQIQSGTDTVATVNSSGITMGSGKNLVTNAPAFRAYLSSNQTFVSGSTFTKVQFDTKEFDITSDYDNSTNYRFTPSVEGYYLISSNLLFGNIVRSILELRKNGTPYQRLYDIQGTSVRAGSGSILVYLNGSTDYIEVYGWRSVSGDLLGNAVTNASRCSFQGHLVRAV